LSILKQPLYLDQYIIPPFETILVAAIACPKLSSKGTNGTFEPSLLSKTSVQSFKEKSRLTFKFDVLVSGLGHQGGFTGLKITALVLAMGILAGMILSSCSNPAGPSSTGTSAATPTTTVTIVISIVTSTITTTPYVMMASMPMPPVISAGTVLYFPYRKVGAVAAYFTTTGGNPPNHTLHIYESSPSIQCLMDLTSADIPPTATAGIAPTVGPGTPTPAPTPAGYIWIPAPGTYWLYSDYQAGPPVQADSNCYSYDCKTTCTGAAMSITVK
jgi:hypothetical protein